MKRFTDEYQQELNDIMRKQKIKKSLKQVGKQMKDEPVSRFNPKTPLLSEVPFGEDDRNVQELQKDIGALEYIGLRRKHSPKKVIVRPPKPTQRERKRIIQAKIKILKAKIADMQKTNTFGQHSVIDQEGNILEKSGSDHYDLTREHFNMQPDAQGNRPDVSDYDIHQMLRDNNWVRVQNFSKSRNPHISVHIANPITYPQFKTLKQLHEDNPNVDLGYFIGNTVDTAKYGSTPSLRELMMIHNQQFGTQKNAQESSSQSPDQIIEAFQKQYSTTPTAFSSEGFGFDPRRNKVLTPESSRQFYGKDGYDLHFIANSHNLTDNPVEGATKLKEKLQDIIKAGNDPFIGGWTDPKNGKFYLDASFVLNTNDNDEVVRRLNETNQKESYSVLKDGSTTNIKNPFYKEVTSE